MFDRFRDFFQKVFTPPARFLTRHNVSPDVITILGTALVVAAAFVFYPLNMLFLGSLVITICVFADTLDGVMARMQNRSSKWGAFLDSTLDRVADAAVFFGLMIYFLNHEQSGLWAGLCVACLVLGQLTSYARARAESLGMSAKTGIAERADRLVVILVGAGFYGLGVPWILQIALVVLTVASAVTVVQRILMVRRQAFTAEATAGASEPRPGDATT